jgi:hypothetical protein
LKIDFKNAFNPIERDEMLNSIKEKTPKLFPFLWQCYSSYSFLFYGDDIILSEVRAQQGDPLGPLSFSLTIHPIIESILSELNLWYLDDGTLGGNPETVLTDFKTIIEKCKTFGLQDSKSIHQNVKFILFRHLINQLSTNSQRFLRESKKSMMI